MGHIFVVWLLHQFPRLWIARVAENVRLVDCKSNWQFQSEVGDLHLILYISVEVRRDEYTYRDKQSSIVALVV